MLDYYLLSEILCYCDFEDVLEMYKADVVNEEQVYKWFIDYGDFDAYYR